jgi:hypothetical protein
MEEYMLHKFIEISKGEEQNYLNAGYSIVTNISNDWIYLTTNLYYVRAETIAAVAELDVSLEKQESKGLITILRSEKIEVVPEEKPANENLKKLKKTIKSDNNADVSELLETTSEEEPKNTDKTEPLVLQETDITDIPDENKGTEVQETA